MVALFSSGVHRVRVGVGNYGRAYLGEHGNLKRLQYFNLPDYPVSSLPPPLASGIRPDAEPVKHDGISPLQDFHITNPGIRDVGVHARRPVPTWACSRTSGDRLVISPTSSRLPFHVFTSNAKREVTGNDSCGRSYRYALLLKHTLCNLD